MPRLTLRGIWISTRADLFLPVRVLAEVRGLLLVTLETANDHAESPGRAMKNPHAQLKGAATTRCVVYCKSRFAGPIRSLPTWLYARITRVN